MQCSDIVYEPDVLLLNSSWYASRFLGYLLAKLLARSSANTAAVVRTTVGVTRMNAGTADNVLPDNGAVLFNFRLLPGQEPVLCCAVLCCAVLGCAMLGIRYAFITELCQSKDLQTLGSGPAQHNKFADCMRTVVMTVGILGRRAAPLLQLSVCAESLGPVHCRPFPGLPSTVLAEAPVKPVGQGQIAASWRAEGPGSNACLISLQ